MADGIKFRCKACEKKIAVRAEYAGKKAKCPGCKRPLRVPSPRPKRSATGVPVAAGLDSSPASRSGSGVSLADLAAMEANADAELKELSAKAVNRSSSIRIEGGKDCPGCGSSCKPEAVLCVHCGHCFDSGKRLKTKKSKEGKVTVKSAAAGTGKAALGLAIASVVAIVFAGIWVGIAYATDREFGFVAWILGGLVGFTTALIARTQNQAVGLAAAGISFMAWALAKAMIFFMVLGLVSQWAVLDSAFPAIAHQMYTEQAFDSEMMQYHESLLEMSEAESEEDFENINLVEAIEKADKYDTAVYEYGEDLDQAEIDAAVAAYNTDHPDDPISTELSKQEQAFVGTFDYIIAFFTAFGLLDILWVFLMVGTAYKVASHGEFS